MKKLLLKILTVLGVRDQVVDYLINKRALKLYGSFISKNNLVFDVGANVGNRAKLFLDLGARVICVEPQKKCVEILKNRFNNQKEVTIIPKGLSDQEGTMTIYTSDESSVIATMSNKWKDEGRFTDNTEWNSSDLVEVTTLDTLINQFGTPSFCKIDVEGFEKNVIAGLSKKIPVISFEFTSEFFDDAEICIGRLGVIGNIVVNYSLGESMLLESPSFLSAEDCINEIKRNPDNLLWGDIYVKFVD